MGRKITLEQAIYQGDRIVTFACVSTSLGGICGWRDEARLIEMIDAHGPLTRLDEIPATCPRCGRSDCMDTRARPFRRDGAHYGATETEGDGITYGNAHIWWLHEENGRNRDGSYK